MRRQLMVLAGFAVVCAAAIVNLSSNVMASPAVLTAPVARDACVWCDDPNLVCVEDYHLAVDTSEFQELFTRNGGAHLDSACRSGSCWTMHGPECSESGLVFDDASFESLRLALVTKDVPATVALVEKYRDKVSLNESRSAVQVRNCRGLVTAHLPIENALFKQIAHAVSPVVE